MTRTAVSRNRVPIRLTEERWAHIAEEHPEMVDLLDEVLQAISEAKRVLEGGAGELLAIRPVEIGKVLVVVYKESSGEDGFVITAFMTRRLASLDRRRQLWP